MMLGTVYVVCIISAFLGGDGDYTNSAFGGLRSPWFLHFV